MKDLGPCHHYLDMKIDRNFEAKTLTILQSIYIQKALKSIEMQDCKSTATPIVENSNLVTNLETAKPSSIREYQLVTGISMYTMTQTCPNLIYSVFTLSKLSSNLSKVYTIVVKQVYRYLQGIKSLSLIY